MNYYYYLEPQIKKGYKLQKVMVTYQTLFVTMVGINWYDFSVGLKSYYSSIVHLFTKSPGTLMHL